MRVKVVIFALVLIGIFVYLPNQNQAYLGPPYCDRFGYPSEHPWQHDGSPRIQDSLDPVLSRVVVLFVGLPTKAILLIQTPGYSTVSGEKAGEVSGCQRDKQHFHGKR